jgi:hypothetical protein
MRPLALAWQAPLLTVLSPRAVVPGIEREIVRRAVEPDPVGRVDPAAVRGGRAVWVRTCDRDPAALVAGDRPDLVGDLGQVLILAEDQGDVVLVGPREADDVQDNPDVDPLLLADESCR